MIHKIDHDQYPHFTEFIEVPFTAEEMAMIKRAAADRGLGPLTWARNVVRATAEILAGPQDDLALRGDRDD